VSSGILKLGLANAVGASSAVTVAGGATFDLAGFGDTIGSLAGAGSVTSTAAGAVTLTSGGLNTSTAFSGVVTDGSGSVALTKAGTGTLTVSGVNTYSGVTTIAAGTLAIAADAALGAAPGAPTPGKLVFSGGTLQITASFSLDPNRGIALTGAGTFDVASGTTLVYSGTATGAGSLTKVSAGALDLSGANASVGGLTISGGTLSGPGAGSFAVAGDWTNNASAAAFVAGSGTVTLNGTSPQVVGGSFVTTFKGLTIANASGITLATDATLNGMLTFTSGTVTTGVRSLYLASGGTVSRTSGHVVGNFKKYVATGSTTQTFEVGDASNYTPVTVAFANVSVAGNLTVSTTAGDHPAIGTSTLDPTKTANRYWTLTNSGITFTTYSATFNFVNGDLDAGVDTNRFAVEAYSGGTWTPLAGGTRTATSTQATGIATIGDFAVGELAGSALDHFVVTAPATATAGSAFNVTVTAVDVAGNTVTGYTGTITFSSTDTYAAFSPSSYTFLAGDYGTRTFTAGATLRTAGSQTISVSGSSKSGTSGPITVNAGAFAKLLILVPGEVAAPGSPSGKTGSPNVQTANSPFTVTVRAVDAFWNPVASTDTVAITSSDAAAVLPANAALVAGAASFPITLESGGLATITATDVTDGTRTASTSPWITVTNTAPITVADSYTMTQGNSLSVPAAGVLSNDTDPQGQPIVVADPRPISGPSHGTLTLNPDGSFVYTPDPSYSGIDTFTYAATDGYLTSAATTVTITIASTAYVSSSGWATTFNGSRYLKLTFPAYVPAGSVVTSATFRHEYRSATAGDTTCYYFEVYDGATLIGTHGSAGSPISCNATSSWLSDAFVLPEVNTPARADNVTIKLYVRNSGGRLSQHRTATLGINYSLD
ncbi:MAG: Ig-like domain-containing protein, partial [Chloroflexota bacterium]|nr:Ig-like domain-containing protein [Chloroflexota bacterium]